ncbi:hypothetical protein OKW24_000620 [Peribacillus simplex]|uniref:hypothetical protein n=2 Tax=Peribacillus TaxID=2675229 RepID=UPI0024E1A64F|nr:hypothetical protein [Peribacillus simplex]MDF9758847.1 hypothetical protein [Peribacillus simplex]
MKDNEPYIQNVKREFCERNMVAIIIEAFTNNEKETRDLNSMALESFSSSDIILAVMDNELSVQGSGNFEG